ncbi:hypothetical protein [Rhizobium laguerreae]|uniref:hypothetical protein n=1 Tax=Rhizobium laguerreae TaxID=1076926 RepID=UPI001C91988A|nr:hypothetical protein [Rhizobium laguerreae]MBY3378910.1 hypothetical protein [Rhizobium laguerreae]
METISNWKSPDTIVAANRRLDSAAPLSILRKHFGLSNDVIAEIHDELVGPGLGRKVTWGFETGQRDSLPGIFDVFVNYAAATTSGIAKAALKMELATRRANNSHQFDPDPKNLIFLKRQLEDANRHYAWLTRLLRLLQDSAADTGRALDHASVEFAQGQAFIIRARIAGDLEEKRHHLVTASGLMAAASDRLKQSVSDGARIAEIMDVVLAVNAGLNEYFVAWELDDLEEDPGALVRAKNAAHKYARPLFLKAANDTAIKQNDGRVAFNAASIAGLGNQPRLAALSLALASKLDGHVGPITEWEPAWLPETLSSSTELADAMKILNAKEK